MHFAVHERSPIERRVRGSGRERGMPSASQTINNSIKLYNVEASVCT